MWLVALSAASVLAMTWACWRCTTLAELAAAATSAASAGAPASAGVSVIVPARDEEETLPVLLASLASSRPTANEVIVVDDASVDATAQVAAAAGATVVPAPPLPAGWAGKPWACTTGAHVASGHELLFLDADTWLAPDALSALRTAHGRCGGLLSVQPMHHPGRAVEELSALFNVVAVAGSGLFTATSSRARGVAFGPCLLTSRHDYDLVGGHAASPATVIEDIALARAYVAHDLPVTGVLGGDLLGFRMYPDGFAALVRGWTKNIALGAGSAPIVPTLAVVLWVAALAATTVDTVIGLADWAGGAGLPVLPLVVYLALVAHLRWLLRRVGSFRLLTALAFPLPLAVFVAVFLRSLLATVSGRDVVWRGRKIATRTKGPA